jgi:hypothetical protein
MQRAARKQQFSEALAAVQERLSIYCPVTSSANWAASSSSLDRHEIAARPATQ